VLSLSCVAAATTTAVTTATAARDRTHQGGHLLNHDDVIGTRAVSFIIYLTDPDDPWAAADGGALELYPLVEGEQHVVHSAGQGSSAQMQPTCVPCRREACELLLTDLFARWVLCSHDARPAAHAGRHPHHGPPASLEQHGHVCGAARQELPLGAGAWVGQVVSRVGPCCCAVLLQASWHT
jgi:hypothetical protein